MNKLNAFFISHYDDKNKQIIRIELVRPGVHAWWAQKLHKTHLTHTSLDLEFLNGSMQMIQKFSSSEDEFSAFTLFPAGFFTFLFSFLTHQDFVSDVFAVLMLLLFQCQLHWCISEDFRAPLLHTPVSFLGLVFVNGLMSDGLNDLTYVVF